MSLVLYFIVHIQSRRKESSRLLSHLLLSFLYLHKFEIICLVWSVIFFIFAVIQDKCSSESEVVCMMHGRSYGVVLWEIVTLAAVPYCGSSNEQIVQNSKNGIRNQLDPTPDCPPLLYVTILNIIMAVGLAVTILLANVNSRSCSLYVIVRPSVRLSVSLSSVTFVHPTQAIEIFRTISTPCGTLAIHDRCIKILRRSSQGNPFVGG